MGREPMDRVVRREPLGPAQKKDPPGDPDHAFVAELRALTQGPESAARRAHVMDAKKYSVTQPFRGSSTIRDYSDIPKDYLVGRAVPPPRVRAYAEGKYAPPLSMLQQLVRDYNMPPAEVKGFLARGVEYYNECVRRPRVKLSAPLREEPQEPEAVESVTINGSAEATVTTEAGTTVAAPKIEEAPAIPPSRLVPVLEDILKLRHREGPNIRQGPPNGPKQRINGSYLRTSKEIAKAPELMNGKMPDPKQENTTGLLNDCFALADILGVVGADPQERDDAWQALIDTAVERGWEPGKVRQALQNSGNPGVVVMVKEIIPQREEPGRAAGAGGVR